MAFHSHWGEAGKKMILRYQFTERVDPRLEVFVGSISCDPEFWVG
jgi:hypothetical protein